VGFVLELLKGASLNPLIETAAKNDPGHFSSRTLNKYSKWFSVHDSGQMHPKDHTLDRI